MIPHAYKSGASAQIASFVRSRMAAGAMSKGQEARLHQFDEFCAREFPDSAALTQGMVDAWAERRPTESANSCIVRCGTVISLVRFLRARGETDVTEPETPRPEGRSYVPHAFTDDELRRFFAECDSWVPGNNMAKRVRVRTQRTMPVIFRLLWSSGIRTCEARRLRVEHVDLGEGVLRIVGGKGMRERLVALNESMLPLMREYDDAMEAIYPGRDYFFPNGTHGHISAGTLCDWFRKLWTRVSDEPATAYELRHYVAGMVMLSKGQTCK